MLHHITGVATEIHFLAAVLLLVFLTVSGTALQGDEVSASATQNCCKSVNNSYFHLFATHMLYRIKLL